MVKRCNLVSNGGNPIGLHNANPLLGSHQCEVEFPDGSTEVFTANLTADNLLSQVDAEGWSYSLLSEIVDHCIHPEVSPRFAIKGKSSSN